MRKTIFFSMLALAAVVSTPRATAQSDTAVINELGNDLGNIETGQEAPPSEPSPPANTSMCLTAPGGPMSLLDVTYGDGSKSGGLPSSGIRGLNPNNPQGKALIDQAAPLLAGRLKAAKDNAVNVYAYGDEVWKDLGAIPEFVRITIEDKPKEAASSLQQANEHLGDLQRDISSGKIDRDGGAQLLTETRQIIESRQKDLADAIAKKNVLEAADAKYKAAVGFWNAQLIALDQQADKVCSPR